MNEVYPQMSCPLPVLAHDKIQLAHGSGGKLSAELVEKLFLPRFGNKTLNRLEDQAVLALEKGRISFSTDTFVVDPVFFPGGNIGDLAINGTTNDICMCGARPMFLSAAFVLEEGLPIADLHRILVSMQMAAEHAGVRIVTGDTKVVSKGHCDKIFINTSGIGLVPEGLDLGCHRIEPGDKIIVSGTIGDHGIAVLAARPCLSRQKLRAIRPPSIIWSPWSWKCHRVSGQCVILLVAESQLH